MIKIEEIEVPLDEKVMLTVITHDNKTSLWMNDRELGEVASYEDTVRFIVEKYKSYLRVPLTGQAFSCWVERNKIIGLKIYDRPLNKEETNILYEADKKKLTRKEDDDGIVQYSLGGIEKSTDDINFDGANDYVELPSPIQRVNAKLDSNMITVTGRRPNAKKRFFEKYFPEIEDWQSEDWVVVFPDNGDGGIEYFVDTYAWAKKDKNADTVYAVKTGEQLLTPFDRWWHNEGSGMPPKDGEDQEEFMRRVAQIAWDNGVYKERYKDEV